MTATATISVDEYRERARAWLADNVERRSGDPRVAVSSLRGMHEFTKEQLDAERPKQKRLYEAGFAGITWPAEFGGQGLSPAHERAFLEEAAGYQLPNLGIAGGTTFGVCAQVMLAHASDDFNRRHLPRMLAGDELWCQFFSEPVAGSDLAGVQTRATRDGETWVLNGAKVWSSWAHLADYGLCLARTNWSVPKHRGLTWFGVPVDAPGVTLRVIRQINGGADFCEEFFDDVVLPGEAVVGTVNDGWTVAARLLSHERDSVGGGSPYIGNVLGHQAAVPPGPRLAADAIAAGHHHDARARQLVGEAHILGTVATALVARIAARGARGPAGAVLKLYRGTSAMRIATIGLELAGPAAVAGATTPGTEYLMRQSGSLAGGSNEMQRNLIAERLLGMPREHAPDRGVPFSQVRRSG